MQLFKTNEEIWATPNEIVLEYQTLKLRHFGGTGDPVLILPPQAGHSGTIADYTAEQSLARLFMQSHDTYVTDWMSVTPEYKDLGLDDYIRLTDMAVDKIGHPVLLVGQCQGGWQAAIYASLYPDKVSGLVVAASPIDTQAEPSKINTYVDLIPECVFKRIVTLYDGLMPGRLILTGFKSMDPDHHYRKKYLDLAQLIFEHGEENLERFVRFNNWYECTNDLAGRFYLEAIKFIFKKNCLAMGGLLINQEVVDLKNITCPLVLIAGEKDHITPSGQVYGMEPLVSSSRILKLMSDGGHIGTLMGSRSLKEIWPQAIEFFRE